ncbi:MAG: hypothetical protein L7S02_07635, partial [Flavobacteriales bacterium]|nr:hypothetical protein [Flavobacteriales bacterium]
MASPFALKVKKIEGCLGQRFGFPKHLIHIARTKGLVSFGIGTSGSSYPFEFNVKGGGTNAPPFLLEKSSADAGLMGPRGKSVLVLVEEEILLW